MWLLHKYEAHIKGLPICFSEDEVKNDVTDNNNKHFVTAFEGECKNIIELREHLKLCFLWLAQIYLPSNARNVYDLSLATGVPTHAPLITLDWFRRTYFHWGGSIQT